LPQTGVSIGCRVPYDGRFGACSLFMAAHTFVMAICTPDQYVYLQCFRCGVGRPAQVKLDYGPTPMPRRCRGSKIIYVVEMVQILKSTNLTVAVVGRRSRRLLFPSEFTRSFADRTRAIFLSRHQGELRTITCRPEIIGCERRVRSCLWCWDRRDLVAGRTAAKQASEASLRGIAGSPRPLNLPPSP